MRVLVTRALSLAALLVGPTLANDPTASIPRPTPVTRPEMKRLLEDMKQRTPRIPLPELTEEEQKAETDPRSRGYEGRLRTLYLPGSDLRGYLYFAGSPARRPGAEPPRFTIEPDPTVTLDYGFKTKLFWIASRANNCQYCLGHQESKLLAVGMTDDDLAALDTNWDAFPPNEQAAFALARRLTLEPHRLTDADIERCRKYYSDLQILEMALSVGGNNAINRWKEGVGVPQSTSGGNFGGRAGAAAEDHSYLTPTSSRFEAVVSKVAPVNQDVVIRPVIATALDRPALETPAEVERALEIASKRSARLPVASDEQVQTAFKDLAPASGIPGWMRLLANFPGAGLRTATAFIATEKQSDLSPLLRAQIDWVVARQDRAWYALGGARKALKAQGQTDTQIADLDGAASSLSDKDRALLTVARNLAASPVVLTDAQVAEAVRLAGPRDVVQTVHYVAMRALFDRFTEAAGLPVDP